MEFIWHMTCLPSHLSKLKFLATFESAAWPRQEERESSGSFKKKTYVIIVPLISYGHVCILIHIYIYIHILCMDMCVYIYIFIYYHILCACVTIFIHVPMPSKLVPGPCSSHLKASNLETSDLLRGISVESTISAQPSSGIIGRYWSSLW